MIKTKRERRILLWIVTFVMVFGLMAPSLMPAYAEETVQNSEAMESVEENAGESSEESSPEYGMQENCRRSFEPECFSDIDEVDDLTGVYGGDVKYYTVTVNPNNDGLDTSTSTQVKEDTAFFLPDFTFNMPEGKQFGCWLVIPEGQDTAEMQPGDSINATADMEIRALYEPAGSDPGDGGLSDEKEDTPKTGDNNAAALAAVLMLLSAGISVMVLRRKREDS